MYFYYTILILFFKILHSTNTPYIQNKTKPNAKTQLKQELEVTTLLLK